MKPLDLIVVTNAITDEVYNVSEDFLQKFKIKKTGENRDKITKELQDRLKNETIVHNSPAGAPANVGFSCAKLGLNVGMVGTLGTDDLASEYKKKMLEYGITDLLSQQKGQSGLCLTFITPDGERSFWGKMNVAENHDFDLVNRRAKVIHTSGYELFSSPNKILEYLEKEKKEGAKISIDLADGKSCKELRPHMGKIFGLADLLFASQPEYSAALGKVFTSLEEHPYQHEILFMKDGSNGSEVFTAYGSAKVPIIKVPITNLNGAGDSYSAGAITTYINSGSAIECAKKGTGVASKVIQMVGAHL